MGSLKIGKSLFWDPKKVPLVLGNPKLGLPYQALTPEGLGLP